MKLTSTPAVAERVTALASAAAAIALLGLAVTAQTGRHAPADPLGQLEFETRLQFRLGLGHDQTLLDARNAQLDRVLDAFKQSDQTSRDRKLLTGWLREAMARTMPGAVAPLLPVPEFGSAAPDFPGQKAPGATPEALAETNGEDPEEAIVTLQQQFDQPPQVGDASATSPDEPPASNIPAPPDAAGIDVLPSPAAAAATPVAGPTPTLADPLPLAPQPPAVAASAEWTPRPVADEDLAKPIAAAEADTTTSTAVVVAESSGSAPSVASVPPAPQARTADDESPIVVNTDRLSLEIASYHAQLGQVRADCRQPTLSLDELQDAVDTLERLTTQYDFVRLYHDLLTPVEQRRLTQPTDWAQALPEVRDALDRVAKQTDGDFLRPLESDRQEAINELRQQVEKLSRQANR